MQRYSSRKFIVTMAVIAATVFLAYVEQFSEGVGLALAACVGAYNAANAVVARNGHE